MNTIDIVIPAAVLGFCVLVVLITLFVKRDRTPKWSIDDPFDEPAPQPDEEPVDLASWHQSHSAAVVVWIGAHEAILRRLGDAKLALDRADTSATEHSIDNLETFKEATAAHPSPVMRAELSAMQVAADATLSGVRKADYETAERHHLTYVAYRDEWIARLRQFALDDPSLVDLRRVLTGQQALSSLTTND